MSGRAPPTANNRRRFIYTQTDQRRWFTIGALLLTSAATLGYLYGQYSEKHNKQEIKQTLPLNKSLNDDNNTNIIKNKNKINNCDAIEYERDYRILVYGDSTTWGYNPDTQNRLQSTQRYPCILQQLLNNNNRHEIEVISEGLNGRTINHQDLHGNVKNERRKLSMDGTAQILPILYSHKQIDILVIMLGINDCKAKFNPSPHKIGSAMNKLILECINAEIWPIQKDVMSHGPVIILISPPSVTAINETNQGWTFNNLSINVSKSLHRHYAKIKHKFNKNVIHFINANDYIQTGSDSVHIDAKNNKKLAHVLYKKVCEIIDKFQVKPSEFGLPSFTSSSYKLDALQGGGYDDSCNDNSDAYSDSEDDTDADDEYNIIDELEQQRTGGTVIIEDIDYDAIRCDSNDKKYT